MVERDLTRRAARHCRGPHLTRREPEQDELKAIVESTREAIVVALLEAQGESVSPHA
jgi:hypothetical protein